MSKMTKDTVYDILRKRIIQGSLPLGGRISELGFAKELGVSRTPVREAFGRLVHEGLAEHVPNAGVYLKAPTRQDIWELYDLRAALETHAVAAAAAKITPQLIEVLEASCRAMKEILLLIREERRNGPSRPPEYYWQRIVLESELPFHLSLVRAARNSRLSQLVSNSQMLIRIYGLNYIPNLYESGDSRSYREHRRILLWLKRGDGEKAAQLMRKHLLEGRERTLDYYDQAHATPESSVLHEWGWMRQIQDRIESNLDD